MTHRRSGASSSVKRRLACAKKSFVGKKGFTLLEVLIALALGAVIAAALYSSFSIAHSAVETVDSRLLKLQEARAFMDVIRREMESGFCSREKAYSVFKIEDRDFYGRQASRLSLTAFTPLVPEVVRVEYFVVEQKGKFSLQKRISRTHGKPDEGRDETLIDDIHSFTLEVLYKGKWIKTWDCSLVGAIPDQVRISLGLQARRQGEDRKDGANVFTDYAFPRVGSRL